MRFSAKRCAYSDIPRLSSQSAICCMRFRLATDLTIFCQKVSDRRSDVNSPLSLRLGLR